MVVAESKLTGGAQHAIRVDAADLSPLDLQPVGQPLRDKRHGPIAGRGDGGGDVLGGRGLAPAGVDHHVQVAVTLAGALQGALINGFVPQPNDTFFVVLNDDLTVRYANPAADDKFQYGEQVARQVPIDLEAGAGDRAGWCSSGDRRVALHGGENAARVR